MGEIYIYIYIFFFFKFNAAYKCFVVAALGLSTNGAIVATSNSLFHLRNSLEKYEFFVFRELSCANSPPRLFYAQLFLAR